MFPATIHFKTDCVDEEIDANVRIHFDQPDFPTVIMIHDLPPNVYPIECNVTYQSFEFINNNCLLIKGFHKKYVNTIGNYAIKIIPS